MREEQIERLIRRLEAERYAAMIAGNVEVLDRLLSERLIYSHSNAERDSKSSYLERVRNGTFVYSAIAHPIEQVFVTPDMVAVVGRMEAHASWSGDARVLRNASLAVWVREDEWRLGIYQPTPIGT